MTIFYVDTSSNYLYTGIVKDDILLVSKKLNLSHDLSTFAIDEISKMFKEIDFKVEDIDKIIAVSGPGSFTGIRIGLTIAKIYAFCLNKEITTITSLEAMSESCNIDELKVPVIDARRGYVYASIHHGDKVMLNDQYISLEKLLLFLKGINKEYKFIGNDKIKDLDMVEYNPDILNIVKKYKNRTSVNPHTVVPTYLKLTEAEESLMKEV